MGFLAAKLFPERKKMDIVKDIKGVLKILGVMFGGLILLVLIAHTVFDIYVRVEFGREVRRLKESGEPTSFNDFAKETIPEEQNAATLYRHIFPTIHAYEHEWKQVRRVDLDHDDFAMWTTEQKADIPAILARYNNIIDLAHEASLRPYCDFQLGYGNSGYDDFSLIPFPTLSRILCVQAVLDKKEGQMEQAVRRITDGLAVAEAAGATKYFFVSDIAQVGCDGIMLDRLEKLLAHEEMSQQGYQMLYDSLKGHRERRAGSLLAGFRSQRCNIIRWFKKPSEALDEEHKFLERWPFLTLARWPLLHELKSQNISVEMAGKPYWETYNLNGHWKSLIIRSAKRDARLGAAELAAGIYIYKIENGNYPESLDKLVPGIVKELPPDPFTGESFTYRPEGNGFIIYSLGENRRDDGGERESPDDDISWKSGETMPTHSIAKPDSL